MANSILNFIFHCLTKINTTILSVLLLPLSNLVFTIIPIDGTSLFYYSNQLFNEVIRFISFISIIIRQLTCMNDFVYQALIIFFYGKISFLLYKAIYIFIINVLRIFHIKLSFNNDDEEEE